MDPQEGSVGKETSFLAPWGYSCFGQKWLKIPGKILILMVDFDETANPVNNLAPIHQIKTKTLFLVYVIWSAKSTI